MSSERKTFLIWWTALLLFIAMAAYIKHNKEHAIHERQDDVPTVNPASAPPGRSWSRLFRPSTTPNSRDHGDQFTIQIRPHFSQ
jgi:hypothetical protein